MNWSAEQQRLLDAMGYQLMVMAAVGEAPRAGVAPVVPSIPGAAALAADVGRFPDLERALRRAAGDRDVSGLIDDLERLRREPALKRALWPRLRTLRRSH